MEISLDKRGFIRKPTPDETREISNNISKFRCETTVEELAGFISQGFSWCPATFEGKRNADNFIQQQIIIADIDDQDLNLGRILHICQENLLNPAIVHQTFSSKPYAQKWRVVFVLSEALELPFEVKSATRYIANIFCSDPAVADSARLLYGTNKPIDYLDAGAIIDVDELLERADEYKIEADKDAFVAFEEHEGTEEELLRKISRLPGDRRGLLMLIVKDVKQWIADPSIKGSGYETVFHSCVHLGLVKLLPPEIIKKWVIDEVKKYDVYNPENWRHANSLDKIVESAIRWSRRRTPRF